MSRKKSRVPALALREAFFHVIYEHRYFSLASAAWRTWGPPSTPSLEQEAANRVIPGVGVIIQDSLLLHGRNLVEFYLGPGRLHDTDIVLTDFSGFSVPAAAAGLERFRDPISVHVVHPTAWRDPAYRQQEGATPKGKTRQRLAWDKEAHNLAVAISLTLDEVAQAASAWQPPFAALRDACTQLEADPKFQWPRDLGERSDVDSFLAALGL